MCLSNGEKSCREIKLALDLPAAHSCSTCDHGHIVEKLHKSELELNLVLFGDTGFKQFWFITQLLSDRTCALLLTVNSSCGTCDGELCCNCSNAYLHICLINPVQVHSGVIIILKYYWSTLLMTMVSCWHRPQVSGVFEKLKSTLEVFLTFLETFENDDVVAELSVGMDVGNDFNCRKYFNVFRLILARPLCWPSRTAWPKRIWFWVVCRKDDLWLDDLAETRCFHQSNTCKLRFTVVYLLICPLW